MKLWKRQDVDVDQPAPVMGSTWTMGNHLAAAVTTGVLWAAILSGPPALAVASWQLSHPSAVPIVAEGVDPAAAADGLRAQEFAVRTITTWLEASRGQEALLRALLPQTSSLTLPVKGLTVSEAMVAGSSLVGDGVWSVTVAATVSDSQMVSRRFFTLPVKVVGQAVAAVAIPAEVPSSMLTEVPEPDYSSDLVASSPLYAAAADFLGAYLAGDGDVARFVSPGADIRPVSPAPFVSVKVAAVDSQRDVPENLVDGDRLEVLVTAVAQVSDLERLTVQYPLTVTVRAGRWEISAVRLVPLLTAGSAAGASQSPSASPVPIESVQPATTSTSTATSSTPKP